ncbi:MAG: hypothetical protein JXK05_09670 [Campylobacterales bacterium]|nr:hypothetical protein [Campylobacterales bacterium]
MRLRSERVTKGDTDTLLMSVPYEFKDEFKALFAGEADPLTWRKSGKMWAIDYTAERQAMFDAFAAEYQEAAILITQRVSAGHLCDSEAALTQKLTDRLEKLKVQNAKMLADFEKLLGEVRAVNAPLAEEIAACERDAEAIKKVLRVMRKLRARTNITQP